MSERTGKQLVSERMIAYRERFDPEHVHGRSVLKDLMTFCRAHESTFHADPRVAANLDGRREVWLRIQQHLNLTEQQLWALYGAKG